MSEDVADGGRVGWVDGREEAGDEEKGVKGAKVPEDRNDSI